MDQQAVYGAGTDSKVNLTATNQKNLYSQESVEPLTPFCEAARSIVKR